MMAATILCLVAQVPDGTTIVCADKTRIRIAGLETGTLVPKTAKRVLARLTMGKTISCLPAGNEGPFIAAMCTLPDKKDLACTLIKAKAAVRSDIAWRRYSLPDCR